SLDTAVPVSQESVNDQAVEPLLAHEVDQPTVVLQKSGGGFGVGVAGPDVLHAELVEVPVGAVVPRPEKPIREGGATLGGEWRNLETGGGGLHQAGPDPTGGEAKRPPAGAQPPSGSSPRPPVGTRRTSATTAPADLQPG